MSGDANKVARGLTNAETVDALTRLALIFGFGVTVIGGILILTPTGFYILLFGLAGVFACASTRWLVHRQLRHR